MDAPLSREQKKALTLARTAGRRAAAASERLLAAHTERQDAIAALHTSGLPLRRIARELDVSHTAVQDAYRAWQNRTGAQHGKRATRG